jgi:hypothetical protein
MTFSPAHLLPGTPASDILLASLHCSGRLARDKGYRHSRYIERRSAKHSDYLEWKSRWLKFKCRTRAQRINDRQYGYTELRSPTNRFFDDIPLDLPQCGPLAVTVLLYESKLENAPADWLHSLMPDTSEEFLTRLSQAYRLPDPLWRPPNRMLYQREK